MPAGAVLGRPPSAAPRSTPTARGSRIGSNVWLVLCDSTDAPARSTREGLLRRGLAPVELVTSDDLAHAGWNQRVGRSGARVRVSLRDGRVISSDRVRGTINRLLYPPAGDMMLIRPGDRGYVFQELMAVFMSWLEALPGPMLNRPSPECLSGRIRSLAEWFCLAGRAGLRCDRVRLSSEAVPAAPSLHVRLEGCSSCLTTLFVVGNRVVGRHLPDAVEKGCLRLAALARQPLLGLEFCSCNNEWALEGVTSMPDLTSGGEALLDALASTLRNGEPA